MGMFGLPPQSERKCVAVKDMSDGMLEQHKRFSQDIDACDKEICDAAARAEQTSRTFWNYIAQQMGYASLDDANARGVIFSIESYQIKALQATPDQDKPEG